MCLTCGLRIWSLVWLNVVLCVSWAELVASCVLALLKARVCVTCTLCQSVEHEQWSVEGVFCLASGKGIGFLFHSNLGHGQLHWLCCVGPLICGGRGWHTQPLTKPSLHTTMSILCLLITHSFPVLYTVLPPWLCFPGNRLTLTGLHPTLHTVHNSLKICIYLSQSPDAAIN